jgi:phosphate-selective porin OprO and OprP
MTCWLKRLQMALLALWICLSSKGGFGQEGRIDFVPPLPEESQTAGRSLLLNEQAETQEITLADEVRVLRERLKLFEQGQQDVQEALRRLEEDRRKQQLVAQDKKVADASKPAVRWSGELQADQYWFGQDAASRAAVGDIQDGEAFRRARIAMLGDYGLTEYRIEMDFAQNGRPQFLDVYTGLKDLPVVGRIRVGHFFEPFMLDRLTSNRFTTFMERSMVDQAFAPARNLGFGASNTYADQRGTWAVGLYRSDSDVFGDDVGDGFECAVTGRVTWLAWYDETSEADYLHFGAGYSYRQPNNQTVQFRAEPEARIGFATPIVPFFVDTGTMGASHYQLMGLEASWVRGPFSLQSEYVVVPVDPLIGDNLWFHGWYATASYFLTGEHRPYQREFATFGRVIPQRDFVRYSMAPHIEKGPGAWEIATRLSHLVLNDSTVRGGQLTDLTIGLNWYLNPHLRVTTNYVHAFLDNPQKGHSGTDIYAMRVGFEF